MSTNNLPKLAAPARRALAAANILSLDDLTRWRAGDLAQLHGMGPSALATLRTALAAQGLAFAGEEPAEQ